MSISEIEALPRPSTQTSMSCSISPRSASHGIDSNMCFTCSICDFALHFQKQELKLRCSICNQNGDIMLTCDRCGLRICCKNRHVRKFRAIPRTYNNTCTTVNSLSCYSYLYHVHTTKEPLLYGGQKPASITGARSDEEERWLRSMWQSIIHNPVRFREELYRASKVEEVCDSKKVETIFENIQFDLVNNLVRLYIVYESKVDKTIVEWFSSFIQLEPETVGVAALETAASLRGRLKQVKWLVEDMKVDPTRMIESIPVIGYAAMLGDLDVVEYLLGVDPVDPSESNNFAIRLASSYGHFKIVERLLQDSRVDPSENNNYAIGRASENGHVHVVERLLQDNRVDPSANENYAVGMASDNGHFRIVEQLLQDSRVDPSANDDFAIQMASENGHLDIVELLLNDVRVDPTVNDNYTIRLASANGHLGVVEQLLQDGRVNASDAENYAFRMASRYGHVETVNRLLQCKDVDPSENDNYAIGVASKHGHLKVVERLLQDNQVDPSANNNYAIGAASNNGHLGVVSRLLQDNQVDPSAKKNYAIGAASKQGHLQVVERLLQDVRVDPSEESNYANGK